MTRVTARSWLPATRAVTRVGVATALGPGVSVYDDLTNYSGSERWGRVAIDVGTTAAVVVITGAVVTASMPIAGAIGFGAIVGYGAYLASERLKEYLYGR